VRVLFAGGGTGGHLYPGLAIARALVRLEPRAQPFFVGAHRGIERDVLPASEFPHLLLDLHPLYRQRPWENWRTVRGLASAWGALGRLTRDAPPAALVATGGYAAGAALAYAAVRGVPIAIQEQNSFPGATVRVFTRWARDVYLGFPEAESALPHRAGTQFLDTGNPIEPPPVPRPSHAEARRRWQLPDDGRVLLVFGGSQGARAVNDAVSSWIDAGLPAGLSVIWATGRKEFERYARHEGPRVRVRPYIAPMTDAYAATDLAVARAGAMGTAEMCAWGIPALLVPLPTAAADHQTVNARALAAAGAARWLPQRELSVQRLAQEIGALLADQSALAALARGALARARPDAAETIARRVLSLAQLHVLDP
jgi:UDP-N-acetylglucosamine--N-acetylmuramyl-(pentapeptide) pyrophosphoryl-undecaprenol N-acetylglucosamine transferase